MKNKPTKNEIIMACGSLAFLIGFVTLLVVALIAANNILITLAVLSGIMAITGAIVAVNYHEKQ